jgi:hypothetical protein
MSKLPKFSVLDVFYHKEKNILLMVDDIQNVQNRGYLYTLKVLKNTYPETTLKLEDDWKKYYEEKLEDNCVVVARKQNLETLYAK